jgi:WD40 repeat protein
VAVGTQRARTAFLVDLVSGVLTKLEPGNVIDVAAFSADGKALALGGRNFEVSVYDTSGRIAGRVRHQHFVRSLALSPNGRYVLTGSVDRTSRLPHDGIVDAAAFNPTGSSFVTTTGSMLRVFTTRSLRDWTRIDKDLRTVSALLIVPSANRGAPAVQLLVPLVAIANDCVALADVRQQRVTVHDAANGREIRHWHIAQRPTALALDRAGTVVAVATGDGRAWLLDKSGATPLADVSSLSQVTTLALSGEWLVAGAPMERSQFRAGAKTRCVAPRAHRRSGAWRSMRQAAAPSSARTAHLTCSN